MTIRPPWVWVAGATLLLGLAGRQGRGTPKAFFLPLTSPTAPLRTGHYQQQHWLSLCKSRDTPFYVTCKKMSSRKVKNAAHHSDVFFYMLPVLWMCVTVKVIDWLLSASLIHSSQPRLAHSDRVSWGAGKLPMQFRKYGSQLGELCSLKGNLVLIHTHSPGLCKQRMKTADSRLLN